ncbi:MAG: hypothetical protein JXA10_19750 [Anaerolineae bacterium]|nr:hypothetical protein [Anaerolineae bacterium]
MADLSGNWPDSIRGINDLPRDQKHAIYQTLIPETLLTMCGIDPANHAIQAESAVRLRCPMGSNSVEISVFHHAAADPVLYLHMGDTFNYQLAVLMAVVNDPASPRFNVDVDENGQPNNLGIERRNIPAELSAKEAGLAPGQVRRGLRVFRAALPIFETFVSKLHHDLFLIEPLFYHNAIIFERYGFAYTRGLQKMKTIHQEFLLGGPLRARLDESTPFRQADAWQTISGRSWAIHDGILGEPLTDLQMYKRIGKYAAIQTFPDAIW